MKRFKSNLLVLTAVLFLMGGAAAFAGGQNENAPQAPGTAGGQASQVTVAKTLTTVTGQIQIVNRIHPVIKNGSESYELMVPRFDVYQSGVKEGQTVTVKGYKVDGMVWGPYAANAQNADTTPVLLVSSATIGGKTYDLQQWADQFKVALQNRGTYGPGFRGPGYGPMMGYGPRGRDGRGPRGGYGRGFERDYGPGYGMGYGMGYGPGFGPGFGPGMGYRYQSNSSNSN